MPIYAYRCETCGHAKDVLQKMSDPVLTTCPACGAETYRKQLTAAGFQLKGSGWYVTDFRGGDTGKKPAAEGEAAKPAEGGDAAKADAPVKTAAGSEAPPATPAAAPAPSKVDSSKPAAPAATVAPAGTPPAKS